MGNSWGMACACTSLNSVDRFLVSIFFHFSLVYYLRAIMSRSEVLGKVVEVRYPRNFIITTFGINSYRRSVLG